MVYCAVKYCGKNTKTSCYTKDGISFHKFPDNSGFKEKWIEATQKEDWFPNKYSVICSRHFTPDCFESKNKRRRLFASAVPTQFLPILTSSANTVTSGLLIENGATSQSPHDFNITGPPHDLIDSPPKSTEKVNDSQIEELTPRERVLKRRINHLIYSLHRQKKHAKRLQDQNRKLRKKNANLQQVLNTLTDKSNITKKNEDVLNSIGVDKEIVGNTKIKNRTHT